METRRQDRDILSHQFRGQQGGGTSTHVAPRCEREGKNAYCIRLSYPDTLYA